MIIIENTAKLAQLLAEAAHAHHDFEAENGKDEFWPLWYAEYVQRTAHQAAPTKYASKFAGCPSCFERYPGLNGSYDNYLKKYVDSTSASGPGR